MVARILIALLVLLCIGCSEEEIPIHGIYSVPKDGRIMDFGPQGLFAEKNSGRIVTGMWKTDGVENFSTTKLSIPEARAEFQGKPVNSKRELKVFPPGSEFYESFIREPLGHSTPNEALVGLWKNVTKDGVDLFEFTPWGSMIWVRYADHTGEGRIVGGWGRFSTPKPGVLRIKSGREFDYTIDGFEKFNYEFEGEKFVAEARNKRNKKMKLKLTLQKISSSDLDSISQQILAAQPAES